MKTKNCKYCKESISAEAVKCPKCQSFQSKWFHPLLGLLPLLLVPLFLIPLYKTGLSEKNDFFDYKEKIKIKVIRKDTLNREDCKDCALLNLLVELDNKTKVEWEKGEYEVEFRTTEGELLTIEKQIDYQLRLRPNDIAVSSVKVPIFKEYSDAEIVVRLLNLRESRY